MKTIKFFETLLEELKQVKFVQNWNGIWFIIKSLFNKTFYFICYIFYFFICLFIRIGIDIKNFCIWLWNKLIYLTSKFPKAFIVIFILLTIVNIAFFRVRERIMELSYSKKIDSLYFFSDSIQRNSNFDSGYSKALSDYSAYLNELDSENHRVNEQKKIEAFLAKKKENLTPTDSIN